MTEPIYDLKKVSERLGISVRTLRGYCNSGKLKARKIGRSYFLTESQLLDFIEAGKEKDERIRRILQQLNPEQKDLALDYLERLIDSALE